MTILTDISPVSAWIILAVVLAVIEMTAWSGFLIGMVVAALLNVILLAIGLPLTKIMQWLIFSIAAIVFSFSYWKFFKKFNLKSDKPALNHRVKSLLGKSGNAIDDFVNGAGKVQIDDTFWAADAEGAVDIKQGDKIAVIGIKGDRVVVKPT